MGVTYANRIHIGFFGRRNAGKSSVVNAVTNQAMSVVSAVMGTTTDPVTKAMELLPLGPVLIIDTPGYDDVGELGEQRVKRTMKVLNKTDIAVLVVDATEGMSNSDYELLELFKSKGIKYLLAYNKCDLLDVKKMRSLSEQPNTVLISAKDKKNIDQLKEMLGLFVDETKDKKIVSDLLSGGDTVLLVMPVDEGAPKDRIILPQQQVIRELLEADIPAVCVNEKQIDNVLLSLKNKPKLVITDSQVFSAVMQAVPRDIKLTSFSILMARYKGFLETAVNGAIAVDGLRDGDRVLISEGCTHKRQCGDIGTVKLPAMLLNYTGKKLLFDFTQGTDFPEELGEYKLIIHCGGCMLGEREIKYRMKNAMDQGIPFTNYGTVIALVNNILARSLEIIKEGDRG